MTARLFDKGPPNAALAGLTAALLVCLAAPGVAAGAKKKGGGAFEATKTVNTPIPDESPPIGDGVDGILRSTVQAGKEFSGRKIRDVELTVQTLGTSARTLAPFAGPGEAIDLVARLDAPNGAHALVFVNLVPSFTGVAILVQAFPSIGPLTLDDEARLDLGVLNPHSPRDLYAPYIGRARPQNALAVMDGGPVRGTWTLTMMDVLNTGTSNLVSWRLKVVAGRPFETK